MSANDIVLVIISGLGVIHGLFLAIFLWSYKKGNELSNRLLSALLIMLSLRIGKSVFLEFTDHIDIKLIFTGLSIIMVIGPLYYLFSQSVVRKSFRLKRVQFVQFVPAVLGFGFGLFLKEHHWETLPEIIFICVFLGYYLHLLLYLLVTYRFVLKEKKSGIGQSSFEFLRLLFFGLLAIWVVYVLNLFDETVPYIIGPILYSLIAYVVSFVVFRKGYVQQIDQAKYKTTPVSDEQSEHLFLKVKDLIISQEQYKNSDLSLKSLSNSLHVSPQILSLVINKESKQNFNSFINHYRIEEAKRLFTLEKYNNYTISAIAFDVGFNSISSFNTTFKKLTGVTPLTYRNQLLK